jgi:RNA polymerase sigma-B factor
VVLLCPETDDQGLSAEERRLVLDHLDLARALARRFQNGRGPIDDLEQVSMLALVKVARRFDPDRNVNFSTYAKVSIAGELKRHLRDRTWGVRVPRSLKEEFLTIRECREVLEQELGRCPTIGELSTRLGLSEESILEAMEAGRNRYLASLDCPHRDSDDGSAPIDDLASDDDPYGRAVNRHHLHELLANLDPDLRLVLRRYFFDERTQQQIGAELGVGQVRISRLLERALGQLRSDW